MHIHSLSPARSLLCALPFVAGGSGPAQPGIQLNCRCGSGLHCTTRRNRIPANTEMLCSLRKSVTAFQISRYPEVCGKPGKTPQPGISEVDMKLNQLGEKEGIA